MSAPVAEREEDQLFQTRLWYWVWIAFASVCLLTLIFEIIRKTYQWLKYGKSEIVLLSDAIPKPQFDWVGVQSMIDYVWNCQLFVVAIAGTFFGFWIGGNLDEQISDLKIKQRTKSKVE